jgi:N-acetylneuraminic acid mutarotase
LWSFFNIRHRGNLSLVNLLVMISKSFKLLLPLFFLNGSVLLAQAVPDTNWYWMGGDYLTNQKGIYSSITYWPYNPNPGARSQPACWTDTEGNLWLFGGWGYDASGQVGSLNDLWQYSNSHRWTWMNGDKFINVYAAYGTKGVANGNNTPGGRYGSVTWVDNDGNLWLFGGRRSGEPLNSHHLLNDLWKYSIATNEWTWVNGDSAVDQVGKYGTMGVADDTNQPGGRESAVAWKDTQGNLWLFGGLAFGIYRDYPGIINDLWKYDILTNQWTWMKGNDLQAYIPGVYGVREVEDAANTPGPRLGSAGWADNNGYLWLWGGLGMSESPGAGGLLNDLWKYNTTTGNWTWIQGSKTINQHNSGAKGIADDLNSPSGRQYPFNWIDQEGNLWIYSGFSTAPNEPSYNPSDLWRYQPRTNQWTWMKGDTTLGLGGLYNVGGVPNFIGRPGGRYQGGSWATPNGGLWLFGGTDYIRGMLNDLWVINTSFSILPVTLTYFSGSPHNDHVNVQWKTETESGFSHFNLQRSTNGASFEKIATVPGQRQPGENKYAYTDVNACRIFSGKLFYRLQIVDQDGAFSFSNIIAVDLGRLIPRFMIVPNPARDQLRLIIDQAQNETIQIIITDLSGRCVKNKESDLRTGRNVIDMNIGFLPAGLYNITIRGSVDVRNLSFLKQ